MGTLPRILTGVPCDPALRHGVPYVVPEDRSRAVCMGCEAEVWIGPKLRGIMLSEPEAVLYCPGCLLAAGLLLVADIRVAP